MAVTRKQLREGIKETYVQQLIEYLGLTEEILRTGSNEIAFPVVDSEGNEDFVVLTVKIPTGGQDGTPYDGYSAAEDYQMRCAAKAAKAEEKVRKAAEAKAKKEAKAKASK